MTKWGLLALSLFAFSCVPRAGWHGSTAFTEEERAQIEDAHSFICARTSSECVPIVWDRAPEDRSPSTIAKAPPSGANRIGEIVMLGGGVIYLAEASPFRRLAAHEFGHWHGLGHVERGLMARDVTTNDLEWSEDDERACQAVNCRH